MRWGRADVADLDTPRLRLQLMEADNDGDRALYCELYNDPLVMHRIAPPLGFDASMRGFGNACRHNRADAPGHRFWRVDDIASQSAIGLAALRREGARAEIGVMLFSEWWNRGICSEIFVALLKHGFEQAGLDAVTASSAEDEGLPVIERLLAPFGFVRTRTGAADGTGHWELPREAWAAPKPSSTAPD
jgi:RimJ/RimL family protein N-acetyltransferase